LSRHFSGDHRYLTSFDSLFLFTTELFNFLKKGEKVQITHLKEIRVRGLVISREGISTLNIRSTLREPFDFILLFCAITCLFLFIRRNWKIEIKRKERSLIFTYFIDLKGQGPLPTYL